MPAFLTAALASLVAGLLGALGAVRRVTQLPPAEAMRPPAPPLFRRTLLGRFRLFAALDQPTRILLRQIGRWPLRAAVTSLGIGMAVAVVVSSLMWMDAIDRIVDVYFLQAQAQDVSVGFAEPRAGAVARELGALPGVLTTEPMRAVPARIRFGRASSGKTCRGCRPKQELHRVFDAAGHAIRLPPEGLVISTMLAQMLGVGVGDLLTVEVLEGRRPVLQRPGGGDVRDLHRQPRLHQHRGAATG